MLRRRTHKCVQPKKQKLLNEHSSQTTTGGPLPDPGVVHAEVLAAAFDNTALTMPLLHLPTTVNMF